MDFVRWARIAAKIKRMDVRIELRFVIFAYNEIIISIAQINKLQKQKLTQFDKCTPYDPTQELIFPPELKLHNYHHKSFTMSDNNGVWYAPTSFDQLLRLKRRHPKSRFISGNSELAIELKFRFIDLPIIINPKQVPELREFHLDKERKAVYVGMGLSLTEIKDCLHAFIAELPEHETAVLRSICAMLHYFAGKHVRNMAVSFSKLSF